MLRVKRVYEEDHADDGVRILVDRLWPRGLRSSDTGIDAWVKELAPSNELRRWFGHQTERWPEFRRRYLEELGAPEKSELLERIARMAINDNVTLVYSARDEERNNARVLEEVIARHLKDYPSAIKGEVRRGQTL